MQETASSFVQPTEKSALSRELGDFLIELSISLHKHAIYPHGHPLVSQAAERLAHRLLILLQDRETLSLGVAREQLVIEGVATDPRHPLLRELAQRLHRQHLGAVRFLRGVEPDDLASFLRIVCLVKVDDGGNERPIGSTPGDSMERWRHIRLFPLTYDKLSLLEGEEPTEGTGGTRAGMLWMGLARAALADAGDTEGGFVLPATPASPEDEPAVDPVAVAKAIEGHQREVAYDQVIVGYLLQIADEVKRNPEAHSLQRRVSRLVGTLSPSTLKQLLAMGGDVAQRRSFLLDATQGLAVDAILQLVRAAAELEKRTISHSLLRMLVKLAAHAEEGTEKVRATASGELREYVKEMVSGWELADPNPDSYREVLTRMARSAPDLRSETDSHAVEPERLVAMSLEVGTVGPLVARAADEMVTAGRLGELVEMLDHAPAFSSSVDEIWRRIATPSAVTALVAGEKIDATLLQRVVARVGGDATEPLLDALERSESRGARSRVLDQLAQLGPGIFPRIAPRLEGAEWFVLRNLLTLIGKWQAAPEGFNAARFATSKDARVRREALKLLFRDPAQRSRAIFSAITDDDGTVAMLGLAAALEQPPLGIASAVRARVERGTLDDDSTALATRVAAADRASKDTLPWLLGLATAGRTLFGRPKLAGKSAASLGALSGLATYWREAPGVAPVLAAAAASPDPEVRAAASTVRLSRASPRSSPVEAR